MSNLPIIAWDYQFAPNAQKSRNLFAALKLPYKNVEQPFFIPRHDLLNIGITYRRVPVISIGKDVYCDNRVIFDTVLDVFDKDKKIARSNADHAFEAFGYRTFWVGILLVPASFITKELKDDRKDLFRAFGRPDFADLRQNVLGELKSMMDMVEKDFLGHGGQWIGGNTCGVADLHAIWIIKWLLETMGVNEEPGFGKEDFPRVYKWIEGLPKHDDNNQGEKMSAEDGTKLLFNSDYAVPNIGVDEKDPVGLKAGEAVRVETTDDTQPEDHPQKGKLVGLNAREIVVELDNGLRVHFPRIAYAVKKD